MRQKIERFMWRNRDKGIKNLMIYIGALQVLTFTLTALPATQTGVFTWLTFAPSEIFKGQVWRLVTFLFLPSSIDMVTALINFIFYVFIAMIGRMLERTWGTLKLNIYYFTGVLAYILFGLLLSIFYGDDVKYVIYGSQDLNFTLFLAYAAMNPDGYISLYFIIRVKAKWMAIISVALMLLVAMMNPFPASLAPIAPLINFMIFFGKQVYEGFKRGGFMAKARAKNIKYKYDAAPKTETFVKPYRHRCLVCGKTDVTHPQMEFRYCGKCDGYACYCEEHIMSHTHKTGSM